ncbi:uncharacterized protein N7469_001805 [Penicillium citrinum]|uniref:Zn(2)-C6 fungal-type domain-containing protein n=1 Tax=Penicillium citrinum TaxID=5077 RepID=A0A9W9PI69_PENCI|nr:uncharacterized protein N7469_001805 [Penicillium citrinum]KAJ5243478.1 hypothetical protein N7469_001805 [Penicillium citrinum]
MPRRKAADRSAPVKTRSRNGCKECRASRVRCDTQKPRCTRCWEKGLPCTTSLVLKWESEFTSRGVAFGRAGVWNKSRAEGHSSGSSLPSTPASIAENAREWCSLPTIYSWGFINTGVPAFENPSEVDVKSNELQALIPPVPLSSHRSVSGGFPGNFPADGLPLDLLSVADLGRIAATLHPSPRAGPSLFPEVTRMGHAELMDYYLQQVCPRTTASSSVSSPFASVILPFSLSASPTLFKAMQALGACHLSRTDSSYGALGLRLKSETLRDLRHRLSSEGSSSCCNDPEILVVMMLLCLYEIVDKCDQQWTIHLKGAKDLIRLRMEQANASPPSARAPDPATAFAEHFFAFQDVMGRTACAKEVLFGSDYWKADDRQIDLWMGCSPELVSLLCAITDMSRTRRSLDSDSARASFTLRAASLERQLEHLVQEVEGDEDDVLASAAEAKRLAAVLYLHCALYSACPTTPLVTSYVRQILQIVSNLLNRGSLASITWPVFVAAVELDPSNDEIWTEDDGTPVSGRSIVLRALAAMTESTIANIARTRAVTVQLWQTRDQDLLKVPQIEGNDWEWYVVPISDAMSLA